MNKKSTTQRIVHIAIFSAFAFVLSLLEFSIPGLPTFLKIDISDVPVMMAGFIVGPQGMLVIIILKNFLHWLMRGADLGVPVGEIANIVSAICFTFPILWMHLQMKSKQKISISALSGGILIGGLLMTLVMTVANYFWLTPFYFHLAHMSLPEKYFQYILVYIPFNLVKASINGIIIVVIYPHIQKMIQHYVRK